jgi:Zn-dependent protease
VGHELMHKVTSFRFGVHAEFRSNDQMLVLSILIAFLGVIFAAPGAVHIWGHVSRRENGIISAAGPAANMVLALLFLPLVFATAPLLHLIGTIGLLVNALLGLFNLIPLWGFDGSKVLAWNKPVYFVMVVLGAVLVVFSYSTVYA